MEKETLEKIIKFYPAYDVRNPNAHKVFDIDDLHVCICMLLKGGKGVVNFIFNTGVYLRKNIKRKHNMFRDGEVDIGYHSYKPLLKWQTPCKNCDFLNGEACYHDCSDNDTHKYLDVLLHKQDNVIWKLLEEYYNKIFYEPETEAITAIGSIEHSVYSDHAKLPKFWGHHT
ncbi:MAG TPA: hypothetical protein ACFYD6_12365 [Candidatus Brocadiia bacterium]|nr:hypothetical protein [Planctomycetota bacterium]MDO8092216.1 hypothetical protein [Candidatus Brocadiales bacterium]